GDQQTVSNELDILFHERRVHSEDGAWECIYKALLHDFNGLFYDIEDWLADGTIINLRKEEAPEVCMETFVAGDKLVEEGETRHQSSLPHLENRREGTAEEDSFDGGKCNEPLSEGRVHIFHPADGPVGLFPDAWK
ncbi:hypothetical protein RUND412_011421, partial [Rhizina undulata]